ncbi:hypothetical protein [Roseomonas gilardii]|uniref:hypothetical protein n=1 Tax=Roseomonas gilardii TaxID=257708 RepID=UPI00119D44A4|nr:hypothetical protein [Roseomonas gilardii]
MWQVALAIRNTALIVALLLAAPIASQAQPLPNDCMRSIAVKPNASIVHFGWLPGAATYTSKLSCTQAESLRERLFTNGSADAFTTAQIDQAMRDPDPKATILAITDKLIAEINGKPPSGLRLLLDLQLFSYSKYTLIYCFLSETGWGAAVCGGNLIGLVVAGYDIVQKLTNTNATDIDKQQALAVAQQVRAGIGTGPAWSGAVSTAAAAIRLHDAQLGLCREIQQSCQ